MKYRNYTLIIFVNFLIMLPVVCLYAQTSLLTNDNWMSVNKVRNTKNDVVNVILLHKGKFYIGGFFSHIGLNDVQNIAKGDGESWESIGISNLSSSKAVTAVNALAFDSSENIYIGGSFDYIGGLRAQNVAKWNGIFWDSLRNEISENVRTIAYNHTNQQIYVAGDVHIIQSGFEKNFYLYVWKWNDTVWGIDNSRYFGDWNDYSTDPCPLYGVRIDQIGFDRDNRYVCASSNSSLTNEVISDAYLETFATDYVGSFYTVCWSRAGNVGYDKSIVKIPVDSSERWIESKLGTYSATDIQKYPYKSMVVDKNGNAYLGRYGGSGVPYESIQMWDGKQLHTLITGIKGRVNALALSENDSLLYVGGDFDTVGKIYSPMIAAVNLKSKSSVTNLFTKSMSTFKYCIMNSHLILRQVSPYDQIAIYSLKGSLLGQYEGISNIDLHRFISQPFIIRITRKNKLLTSNIRILYH